jgi:hypothetical protein
MRALRRRSPILAFCRAGVGALLIVVGAALVATTDLGVRVLVGEPFRGLPSHAENWVVVTQDGDCDAFLRRARVVARASRWPRPARVRNLALSSTTRREDSPSVPVEAAGTIRGSFVRWALVLRGHRSTPVLIRIKSPRHGLTVEPLEEIPE